MNLCIKLYKHQDNKTAICYHYITLALVPYQPGSKELQLYTALKNDVLQVLGPDKEEFIGFQNWSNDSVKTTPDRKILGSLNTIISLGIANFRSVEDRFKEILDQENSHYTHTVAKFNTIEERINQINTLARNIKQSANIIQIAVTRLPTAEDIESLKLSTTN